MRYREVIFVSMSYYFGWFGCVFLARTDWAWCSVLLPLILASAFFAHRLIQIKSLILAICISTVGIVADSIIASAGVISFWGQSNLLIPLWLVSIWLLFSLCMVALNNRLSISVWLASALGMIFGPLSYKSGEAFEVLRFHSSMTFVIYAVFWAVSFPAILALSKRFA